MSDTPMVKLTIDGVPLEVPKGTLLVEAAKKIKQEIPVYCYHTKLGPAGLCRICLVEIEGMPKLQIACNTPVTDGMVVHTQNDKVNDGRSMVLELFLVNHPLDCPICDKGGECDLQDYAMAYGRGSSDVADPKTSKPKGVDLGPTIVLDEERCVVCQRCVRFDDIIANESQLVLKDRGVKDMIATATGDPYRHNFTGNVTELCPVGALTSKTYRFKSRPWDLQRTETSCTQCSVGCRQFVDVRVDSILRTMSVESDDAISDGWLCDRGRYNVGFYSSTERLTQPLYKRNGEFVQIGWDEAFTIWAREIKRAIDHNGTAGIGAIGGGRLTNEEAYLLQFIFRALGTQNVDWRFGRQRQATPGKGSGSLEELERAKVIVVLGESPAERAPVMDLRIRKAVTRNGAKLIRIASYEKASLPSTDVTNAAEALAALPGAASVALVWDGVDLSLGAECARAFANVNGLHTYIAGEQANARGAEAMGVLPRDGGLDGCAMLDAVKSGTLGALALFGVNPVLNGLDRSTVRAALDKAPFAVVSELFMTETAQMATLVLPAKGSYEKSGTTINLAGQLLPTECAIAGPDGALSDMEMLIGLAQQFDIALPSAEELHHAVVMQAAKSADFTFGDARYLSKAAPPVHSVGAEDVRAIVQTSSFAGGGTSAHDERIVSLRPLPQAAISANTAKRLGVQTGDYVDVMVGEDTSRCMHDLLVAVRAGMPDDAVALIGGLPDDPASVLGDRAVVRVTNARATVNA